MQNSNRPTVKLSNRKSMPKFAALGYEHGRRLVPYTYDMAPTQNSQENYERGRLLALEMMSDGIKPPAVTPTGCTPRTVLQWKLSGKIIAPERYHRSPDDETLKFRAPLNRRGFPLPIPTYCEK